MIFKSVFAIIKNRGGKSVGYDFKKYKKIKRFNSNGNE